MLLFRHIPTDSMEPFLKKDSNIVLLDRNNLAYEELKEGMIAIYKASDGVEYIHRILRKHPKRGWVMKGDNLDKEDRELLTKDNYIGALPEDE